ncbi:LuxR C-terminal-related transcriptional regulator [Paenibacillus etheri]|uniref:Transcriptional regulator n=1 Tax=Paenibacillus etheri TaxID=1306852 RepID=A0A0W1AXA0_9BACL|nr:LuxR C-terminal-related transcriptional regulator [Paenibacillus etheri]KTD85948.1 transcriptional regulator [Paenibacillus etheri]
MMIPIVSTKLYIPLPRPNVVNRTRLIEKMNEGLHRKLTLVSASAGFGKTTVVSEWLATCDRPVAWLSIDEGDNDPACFLTYLVASLQTMQTNIGEGVLGLLQSPQSLPIKSLLIPLLNEISAIPNPFILVLDDYHVIKASTIDQAISILIERMPPQMHLVIASREDPNLPIARLRARDLVTEVRVKDLRFTFSESAEFLNQVMSLNLTREEIGLLESRTEGWVAGLQLAALSMLGHTDKASFIRSFSGSHRYILDYLLEEVLQQQSATIQTFLLRTSILDRMYGPLCDAVLNSGTEANLIPDSTGQEILEYLERTNLFIVPLDHERKWYRYHHLFVDLLRKRLQQNNNNSNIAHDKWDVDELHVSASRWYEDNRMELEAFQHAVAAKDIDRAALLIEGKEMPLLFRGAGAVKPVLKWLNSLPRGEMNTRPSLWVMFASGLLMTGQMSEVEEKLQAAEQSIQEALEDDETRDIVGHIAAIRATLAVSKHQSETILAESRRALENLDPGNLPVRTATTWALGYAYQLQRNRILANEAYTKALSISRRIGHGVITIMATLGLGNLREADNKLYEAAETYQNVLNLTGDPPMPIACEAYLGLARIYYEWNDLEAAKRHAERALQLAKQFDHTDRVVACEILLARLMLTQQGEEDCTAICLAKTEHFAHQHQFLVQLPDLAAAHVHSLLRLGDLEAAALEAQKYELPISGARVILAQGNPSAALAVLEPQRREAELKGWKDECLKVMILQAVALQANGEKAKALQHLKDVLILAEPGGFIRIFVDEGAPIYKLLSEAAINEFMPGYLAKLLDGFEAEKLKRGVKSDHHHLTPSIKSQIEPLSVRELEVLKLIAQGLSNREISERLFLALSTVKGHNRVIFDKLQVSRRTEAVALARKLGLL